MKCPHCHRDFTPQASRAFLPGLSYMVGKGWLFRLIAADDKWKTDPELVEWHRRGWIEHRPELGFRITATGEIAIK